MGSNPSRGEIITVSIGIIAISVHLHIALCKSFPTTFVLKMPSAFQLLISLDSIMSAKLILYILGPGFICLKTKEQTGGKMIKVI